MKAVTSSLGFNDIVIVNTVDQKHIVVCLIVKTKELSKWFARIGSIHSWIYDPILFEDLTKRLVEVPNEFSSLRTTFSEWSNQTLLETSLTEKEEVYILSKLIWRK